MKLIYVKIPVISEYSRAYIVSDENSLADLNAKLEKDQKIFEKDVKWYSKPEKTRDGKSLNFHEMSEDWDERH